jgi:hypothetical protein
MGRFFNKGPEIQDSDMLDSLGMGSDAQPMQPAQPEQQFPQASGYEIPHKPTVGMYEGKFALFNPDGSIYEITPEEAAARTGYQPEEIPDGQLTFTESIDLPTKGRITASVTHTSVLDFESESPEGLADARFLALQQYMYTTPHLADQLRDVNQYSDQSGYDDSDVPVYTAHPPAPGDPQDYVPGQPYAPKYYEPRQLQPPAAAEQPPAEGNQLEAENSLKDVLSPREIRKLEKAAAKGEGSLVNIITPEMVAEAQRKARRAGIRLAAGVIALGGVAFIAERGQTTIYHAVAGESSGGASYWSKQGKNDTHDIPLIGPLISIMVPTAYGSESKDK